MEKLIEARFMALLTAEGWSGLGDFTWSLGYCQGDGIAFSGRIEDPALLIQRVMPGIAGDAVIAAFADPNASISMSVEQNRYGPGIPAMQVTIDEGDTFAADDEDSGHQALAKEIVNSSLLELEKLLTDDLRRLERQLLKEGYQILESMDPTFWSSLPSSTDGSHVVLRRIERPSFTLEWRLGRIEGGIDAELLEDITAHNVKGAELVCVALDEDNCEIATSPAYISHLPKPDWAASRGDVRALMQEAFSEIRDELRAFFCRPGAVACS